MSAQCTIMHNQHKPESEVIIKLPIISVIDTRKIITNEIIISFLSIKSGACMLFFFQWNKSHWNIYACQVDAYDRFSVKNRSRKKWAENAHLGKFGIS